MTWYKPLGGSELILILLFTAGYISYFIRLRIISKKFKVSLSALLFKFFLRASYFTLFIIALLGPSFGNSKKEIKAIGKDIFFAVDLSGSMNAFDIQPSRLEKIKFELKNISNEFNSDRMGLIIFSNEAFLQCALTDDQAATNMWIESLHTNLVPNAGTDFEPPLRLALEKLSDETVSSVKQKSKIIILISDGEDHANNTDNITEEIKERGIKLFTLGVGSKHGSKIRTRNSFKTDRQGNIIITKLESRNLKKLAKNTGGKYFEINEKRNDVSKLISTINSIEGELRNSKMLDVSANKYFYFLVLGLALLSIDILFKSKLIQL